MPSCLVVVGWAGLPDRPDATPQPMTKTLLIPTRLEPIKKAARRLKQHVAGLLNYFEHPISNALSESMNSRIQSLKATARGFRSFANYRTRILFFLGKLNLQPAL